jgi:hypothetical protein
MRVDAVTANDPGAGVTVVGRGMTLSSTVTGVPLGSEPGASAGPADVLPADVDDPVGCRMLGVFAAESPAGFGAVVHDAAPTSATRAVSPSGMRTTRTLQQV